jgi:hypothetical protein
MENKVWMAVGFSGKRWNIEALDFFDAVKKLEKNTELETNDPEYVDPDDIFMVIDIPG